MKSFPFCLLLTYFSFSGIKAQDYYGIATYKTSTGLDIQLDSAKVNPEQQKLIMSMLKSEMQKEYELTFDKFRSVYKEVESLEKGGNTGGMGMIRMLTNTEGVVYKDIQDRHSLQQTDLFGKMFLIEDTLDMLNWELDKETKQIGSYTCHKATATKVHPRLVTDGDGNEMMDTTEITAWYTPQIPVTQGPEKFWGLPGLIMEVNYNRTVILCSKITLKPEKKPAIEKPQEGEVVSEEEFREIADKKIKEQQEIYGGANRDRRGNEGTRIRINR